MAKFRAKHNYSASQPSKSSVESTYGKGNAGFIIVAKDEKEAKEILKKKHNLNPFYVKLTKESKNMKIKKTQVAYYKDVRTGFYHILDVSKLGRNKNYIRTSSIAEATFELIDTVSQNDALKAIKIKEAQDRLDVAQKELDHGFGLTPSRRSSKILRPLPQ